MTFDEVISSLQKKKRQTHLLMGNGFSMAFDKEIFSYNALYEFLSSKDDEGINKLFAAIKTKNFELVMQQLDTTLAILGSFNADPELQKQISEAAEKLKNGLINSIQQLHPEHVFKVGEDKSLACSKFFNLFLQTGGHLFTTNYDLLLYWVLMQQNLANHVDGFGRELLNPTEIAQGEEADWSDLLWGPNSENQNVHYLHGALHLFDARRSIIKETYDFNGYLMDNIKARLDDGQYPIFVTAGNGDEKLEHIRHNQYLSYCYNALSKINGSLVTFGFNFGEYDEHIIEAINKANHYRSKAEPKLWSVYIGTYSDSDVEHINSIRHKFHPKIYTYDAKTAPVWATT